MPLVKFISVVLSNNNSLLSYIFNQHAHRVVKTKTEDKRGGEGKGEGRLTILQTCSNASDHQLEQIIVNISTLRHVISFNLTRLLNLADYCGFMLTKLQIKNRLG